MNCRPGCAACCIAISISSPIPGMPQGKPAGVRCVNLSDDGLCSLFGLRSRPTVCREFTPTREMCGWTNDDALRNLAALERETSY